MRIKWIRPHTTHKGVNRCLQGSKGFRSQPLGLQAAGFYLILTANFRCPGIYIYESLPLSSAPSSETFKFEVDPLVLLGQQLAEIQEMPTPLLQGLSHFLLLTTTFQGAWSYDYHSLLLLSIVSDFFFHFPLILCS